MQISNLQPHINSEQETGMDISTMGLSNWQPLEVILSINRRQKLLVSIIAAVD
jgi:hypothetical protein